MAEKERKGDMKHNLAEMYAKNMVDYGVDVTKAWQTATQQSYALEKAYIRGRQYEADRFIKFRKEYNGDWIPCSERLPEEELEKAKKERGSEAVFPVLATINKKHVVTGEKYTTVSRAFYGCYNDKNFYNACCDKLVVIAWQPLPEPYKERD